MLGNGMRRICGNPKYPKSVFSSRLHIHIVKTGTPQYDQLYAKSGKFFNNFCVQYIIYKYTNGIETFSKTYCSFLQRSFKISNLMWILISNLFNKFLIVGFCAEYGYFHNIKF